MCKTKRAMVKDEEKLIVRKTSLCYIFYKHCKIYHQYQQQNSHFLNYLFYLLLITFSSTAKLGFKRKQQAEMIYQFQHIDFR